LFGCSDGLCTKNNPTPCKLDSCDKPRDLISDIAQGYFDSAVKEAQNCGFPVDQKTKELLKAATQAVENDITLTYDQSNGESLAYTVFSYLQKGFNYAKNLETAQKFSDGVQKAIAEGEKIANELIKRDKCPSNGKGLGFRVSNDD